MEDQAPAMTSQRYFYISYNGDNPLQPGSVIGHLAFSHPNGFPSLFYICEVLVPKKARNRVTNMVLTFFYEFKSEDDFEDFIAGHDLNEQLFDIFRG